MLRSLGHCVGRRVLPTILLICAATALHAQVVFKFPQPGDVYKEYVRFNNNFSNDWRVTDPNTGNATAQTFLPNPTLPITIDDLSGAIRAEATLILWGGHVGTTDKSISFNGNAAIPIPDLDVTNGLPAGAAGHDYQRESMETVDIPLNNLVQGTNTFKGNCGDQADPYGFGWGQFGIYGIIVRVYYDPATKAHPTGTITSPVSRSTINDNPTITAAVSAGVTRVDFLAYYDGYDNDGDGIFADYHHDYHYGKYDGAVSLKNHVGTATGSPWQATWQTQWVPDQPVGGVKFLARIKDNSGVWYVTPEVSQVSLARTGSSVRLYKPENVPVDFWTQYYAGQTKSSNFTIPGGTNLGDATAAALLVRTWNGNDEFGTSPSDAPYDEYWVKVNGNTLPTLGEGHFYKFDTVTTSTGNLQTGQNTVEFHSNTQLQHGIEICWPGPAMTVRFAGAAYASPVASAPSLVSPADNATDIPAPPTLTWNTALTATGYRLQVSTSPTFSTLVIDDSTITDTTKQISGLVSQTTYYWRVRTLSLAGGSAFSGSRSFTTLVAAPTLLTPVNATANVPVSARLTWMKSTGAIGYHVQVGTDQTFLSNIVYNDSTITDSTTLATGLANSTTYYWRVRMRNGGAGGPFSAAWSFTTVIAIAPAPSLLSPSNNSLNVPTAMSLRWARSTGAASYRVQVATDSTFATGIVVNDSTIVDTTRLVSALSNQARYFWHVNAKNAGGVSSYSAVYAFTTAAAAPNSPILTSPADQSSAEPTSLTFMWNAMAGATGYHFQLGTDSTFNSGLVKNDTSLATNSRAVVGLSIYAKYYWRVRAKNSSGYGPFSGTWSFTTAMPLPAQVQLVSPSGNTLVSRDTVTLTWQQTSPSVQMYYIDHAIDSLFTFVGTDSTADTSFVLRELVTNKTYYWRVRARNAGGWSPYSETRSFNVVITDVARMNGLPRTYELSQNYPNPFNPSTRIEFSVPSTGMVRLEVANILGQQVAMLINQTMSAGKYVAQFDAGNLPSGLYLYRLTAGATSITRKMMLVK
ncbi:MAG: T9SS type A sorting domain-containing protein [Bacteroidota bacterium]